MCKMCEVYILLLDSKTKDVEKRQRVNGLKYSVELTPGANNIVYIYLYLFIVMNVSKVKFYRQDFI